MADAVEPSPRIEAIDALRGFALIGIFFVNITIMGGPISSETPTGAATLADPNWRVWALSHLFVFGAMRGLFSMLFGASALLFLRNPANTPAAFARRCFWLLWFGVVNATLFLWPGDILLVYALASPVVLLFLGASNRQVVIGGALILLALSVWTFMTASAAGEVAETTALAASPERTARLGDYLANLRFMLATSIEWTFTPALIWWVADAAGFMLIGMALMRWGILSADAPTKTYVMLTLCGFALGLVIRVWEVAGVLEHAGEAPSSAAFLFQLGRLSVSIGWIGAFILAWRTIPWRAIFAPLSALGRMALSGYLLQSIVAGFVFSGFGLALWNKLNWPQLWLLALGINAALSAAFMLWLRVFRMGPFEWVWRWLTFGRAPPLLVRAPSAQTSET
jgi:uncharacterized protein